MKPATEAWIEVAEVDHRTVRHLAEAVDPIPESVVYHVQQCIEKLLKALLEEAGRPIPRTHDLGRLLVLTADLIPDLSGLEDRIEEIAPYAVALRYPHDPALDEDVAAVAAHPRTGAVSDQATPGRERRGCGRHELLTRTCDVG